jgi:alkylated DNA repair dioxygenase AlkB
MGNSTTKSLVSEEDCIENETVDKIEEKKELKRITISPNNIPRVIQLNESGTSFITIDYLSDELKEKGIETFENMWKLHPENKHKIIRFEEEMEVFRYSKSYLNTPTDLSDISKKSYMYSGFDVSKNNDELPEEFNPFYEFIKEMDHKYNQVVANWYEDESDFIAQHSDCKRGMIKNAKISIISFHEKDDDYRTLIVRPRKGTNSNADIFKINLHHGTIITMHGNTQDEFTHGIDKKHEHQPQRMSLSFRQMEN